MGAAIGEILPLALGVAISPVPIIAVILMLLSKRAGATSTSFLLGWIVGIVGVLAIITVLADVAGLTDSDSAPATWVGVLKLVLGVLCLLLAVRQWRQRPKKGEQPVMPKWLSGIENMKVGTALVLGFALSAINPKNLMMILAAGVAIGGAGLSTGSQLVAGAVFSVIAACTVALPPLIYVTMKAKATVWLTSLREWLEENNATVMATLFLVIGVVLVGKGIAGL